MTNDNMNSRGGNAIAWTTYGVPSAISMAQSGGLASFDGFTDLYVLRTN